jgi:hypothetical protein
MLSSETSLEGKNPFSTEIEVTKTSRADVIEAVLFVTTSTANW